MGENSKIEWTQHTFNAWIGCTKVAAGCANCYAEILMDRRYGKAQWGPNGTRVLTSPSNWAKPLKWNRDAEKAGVRARVFCASLADVFEDWSGPILNSDGTGNAVLEDDPPRSRAMTLDDVRQDLFRLIDATPHLDWLLLTKRPENILEMWPRGWTGAECRPNVWLGTSIATQADADKNIPKLLKCRDLSPVLFLSMEPLLGPVDLMIDGECSDWACGVCGSNNVDTEVRVAEDDVSTYACNSCGYVGGGEDADWKSMIDWVIVGGESGPGARPMHPQWARDIRDQCQTAGVPFFFKQWGEYICDPIPPGSELAHTACIDHLGRDCAISFSQGERWEAHAEKSIWSKCGTYDRRWVIPRKVGKKATGRELDGRTWDEFPKAGAP